MKIYNDKDMHSAASALRDSKHIHKSERFASRVRSRIDGIARYLAKSKIDNVVIGLSGGIDSTLVYFLLREVKENYIHDLQIHPVFFTHAIHQNEADESIVSAIVADNFNYRKVDLSHVVRQLDSVMGLNRDQHLASQMAYAMMYTMIFTVAQAEGGITFGTTNFDEFGFAGWFGKNSDMMVDVQPIADWHKFEVRAVLNYLCDIGGRTQQHIEWAIQGGFPLEPHKYDYCRPVLERIMAQSPKGDLLSGATDEEVFGCTYDELSVITDIMVNHPEHYTQYLETAYPAVFELHRKNAHKYQGQTFNPVFIKD